jgi:hypothetical protein
MDCHQKVRGVCHGAFLVAVKGVLDLPENQEVAVIGTLYKEMKLKPSILAEYSKVSHIYLTPPTHRTYCSSTHTLPP